MVFSRWVTPRSGRGGFGMETEAAMNPQMWSSVRTFGVIALALVILVLALTFASGFLLVLAIAIPVLFVLAALYQVITGRTVVRGGMRIR
jgi:predicted PurR-regulated permease PerM